MDEYNSLIEGTYKLIHSFDKSTLTILLTELHSDLKQFMNKYNNNFVID